MTKTDATLKQIKKRKKIWSATCQSHYRCMHRQALMGARRLRASLPDFANTTTIASIQSVHRIY
jgi:hypothetical protein